MKEMKFSLFVSLLALSIAFVISGHKIGSFTTLDFTSDDCLEVVDVASRPMTEDVRPGASPVSFKEELTVFSYHAVDTKPVYGSDCKDAEDSWACTMEKLHLAIREKLDWPTSGLEKGEEAVEEITFVVMPDGSISDEKLALSRTHNCHGCQKAAIDAVGQLGQWIPAIKDGKKVAVRMTLPIRFIPIS